MPRGRPAGATYNPRTRGPICASRPRRGLARGYRVRLPPHRVAQARDEPDPADARDEALFPRLPLRLEQGSDRVPAREAGRRQRLDRRHVGQRRAAARVRAAGAGPRCVPLERPRRRRGRRARRLLPRPRPPRPDREDVPAPEPDSRRHEGAERARSSPCSRASSRPTAIAVPTGSPSGTPSTSGRRGCSTSTGSGSSSAPGSSVAGELRWYGKVDGGRFRPAATR